MAFSASRLEALLGRRVSEAAGPAAEAGGIVSLKENERRYIEQVLKQTGGVIKGPRGAATLLDLPASTLFARMKKLGIERR